jgi:hypothetical protein
MALRKAIRRVIPYGLRASVAGTRRRLRDLGARPRFARGRGADFPHPVVSIVQEIKPSPFLDGKLANLTLGAARIPAS